jgi:hypothetical protein
LSQAEAAARLGVGVRFYHDAEADRLTSCNVKALLAATYEVSLPEPTRGELCALARRRSGLRLPTIAADLGITHLTYLRWERTGQPGVVTYWTNRGFTF